MNILNGIRRVVGIVKHFGVKNKPKLLIGAGVVCLVGAVADGVYVGTKINKVVYDDKYEIDKARRSDDQEGANKAKIKMVCDIGKLFAPVAGMTIGGIAFIGCGVRSYDSRLIEAIGTCNLMSGILSKYRNGVIDEYGVDVDRRLMNAATKPEDNTEGRKVVSPDAEHTEEYKQFKLGKYSRFIGPYEMDYWDPTWDINREYFIHYLLTLQDQVDFDLHQKQVITANDANAKLTIPRDTVGATCGWDSSKVDKVSFGIDIWHGEINPTVMQFLKEERDDVLLNFNCSGFVLEAMELRDRAWKEERNRYWLESKPKEAR